MRICKYCKKPILDNNVWNPDREGNGYHHSCLCEIEFMSRDKQIYNKGRTDVLDKIRAEINGMYRIILKGTPKDDWAVRWNDCLDEVLQIIDKYKAENMQEVEE